MLPYYQVSGCSDRCQEVVQELADQFRKRGLEVAVLKIGETGGVPSVRLEGLDWTFQVNRAMTISCRSELQQFVKMMPAGVDVVLTMGLTISDFAVIEVKEDDSPGQGMTGLRIELIYPENEDTKAQVIPFERRSVSELADHLWERRDDYALQPEMVLWVNGHSIGIKDFVRQFFIKGISGMISTLKGVGSIDRVLIKYEHTSDR
ncbi:hypothetical protein JXQ70_18735 [bacterium]|nr:hypothetical protein [bacterium]